MPDDRSDVPKTRRAYTMRLHRAPGPCPTCGQDACDCLERALWQTHLLVNRGAGVFGDWLLTLRGGIDHAQADQVSAVDQRPYRRRLLALGWLSVEDDIGARRLQPDRIVASGREPEAERHRKIEEAFRQILHGRGLSGSQIDDWWKDCRSSLTAAIRKDAVVVNRSAAFDMAVSSLPGLTRNTFWEDFGDFFGEPDAYFGKSLVLEQEPNGESEPQPGTRRPEEPKELVKEAGMWLSRRFGQGKGADFAALADRYQDIARWCEEMVDSQQIPASLSDLARNLCNGQEHPDPLALILRQLSGPGHKSDTRNLLRTIAETHRGLLDQELLETLRDSSRKDTDSCRKKISKKGGCPWSDALLRQVEKACGGFTYHAEKSRKKSRSRHKPFSVMLDHAARRVSAALAWIRNAEQRRQQGERIASRRESLREEAPRTVAWLDAFVLARSIEMGAESLEGYRIRKRALEGWETIVERWARLSDDDVEGRIRCVRELQQERDDGNIGDKGLFEAMASREAIVVWRRPDGTVDPSILRRYAEVTEAEWNQRRFNIPMFRHPDPFRHPVFVDYGESRWEVSFASHRRRNDSRELSLELWDGRRIWQFPMRWASKRLAKDILSVAGERWSPEGEVPRADRLGRATAPDPDTIHMDSLFQEKEWNGRLQAPRRLLLEARSRASPTPEEVSVPRKLHWFLSFSAPLQPAGPGIRYAREQGIRWRKGGFVAHSEENRNRKGMARLSLCRLPGLRVLSVDLGHRFAAACAVWETLPRDRFLKEVATGEIVAGGSGPEDLFLHLRTMGPDHRPRTRIYRRVAADQLGDGPHPAPWARLERQFLIRLPGEDTEPRKASPEEMEQVRRWEERLGRVRNPGDPPPRRVDELMRDSLDTARLGLRRHGQQARIAWTFTANTRLLPGGREEPLDESTREQQVLQALVQWAGLISGGRWEDPWARNLWQQEGFPSLSGLDPADEIDDGPALRQRRDRDIEDRLRPLARRLCQSEMDRRRLGTLWTARWVEEDRAVWSGSCGLLRWLKDWIAPRGFRIRPEDDPETRLRKRQSQAACRQVGGLSLTRIGNVTDLYRLQKAFRTRPHPEDLRRNIPRRGDEELVDFERRILEMRDRLREQRVKQLSSRIIEAALGLGRHPRERPGHQTPRPERPRDPACHAIVIESLEHYRPEQTRTRRENRMLMQWSSAQVKKYLSDGAALHGLHLAEVSAAYTSRQDSRTGLPGLRCDLVTAKRFLEAPWWRRRVHQAQRRQTMGNPDSVDALLLEADRQCQSGQIAPDALMVLPAPGGEWFVAAQARQEPTMESRGLPRTLQADLNAAANIGLQALLDPDWPGRWWYVPCDLYGRPLKDRVKGSAAVPGGPLGFDTPEDRVDALHHGAADNHTRNTGERKVQNLWSDPDAGPLQERRCWKPYQPYWREVATRVVRGLRRQFPSCDDASSPSRLG